MTKDEALKLALDALEVCQQSNYGRDWVWPDTAHPTAMANVKEAITTIKEAMAQPPIAWLPPDPPPECKTEAEKTAFAFGWWKALETQRMAQPEQEPVEYSIGHCENHR